MKALLLPCLLLFGLVVGTFLPAVHNDFVSYDDARYITANSHVQSGLKWENIQWAFGSTAVSNWHPLTWLSHMLDCTLFGSNAGGHHLVSVLLHAVNTVLIFLFLWRFTRATWRSLFVAAVFGLHPLRVESVAWAAERKDVLSMLFWMLTLWAYAAYAEGTKVHLPGSEVQSPKSKVQSPNSQVTTNYSQLETRNSKLETRNSPLRPLASGNYWLAFLFLALGLMCKPMLVTLPFGLLLLDYWPLERFSRRSTLRLVGEKAPFFLLAAASCAVTFMVQRSAMNWMAKVPFPERVANALVSYWRYLGKLFWPARLSVIYPVMEWPAFVVVLALAALLAVSVLAVAWRRRAPYVFTGWFWFIGTLIPVIGLVAVGEQSMADRYTYIPSIGVLVLLAWGAHDLTRLWRWQTTLFRAGTIGIALACLLITRQNLAYWKNTETLFRHAVQATDNNYRAGVNLGAVLFNQGRVDEALSCFQDAVRFRPDSAEAHADLGVAWHAKSHPAEAMREYEEALRLKPDYAAAHFNLGTVLEETGQLERAIQEYQRAAGLEGAAPFYRHLGTALVRDGRVAEAIVQLRQAISLDPGNAATYVDLGDALQRQGRMEEAAAQFKEALRLDPRNASARSNLNVILNGKNP